MFQPDYDDFVSMAHEFDMVPVYKEILSDMDTPVSAFKKLSESDSAFLLESVEGGERFSRFSFLGSKPRMTVSGHSGKVTRRLFDPDTGESKVETDEFTDPLRYMEDLMGTMRAPELPDLPRFFGGAVGYLGYETVRYFEPVPSTNPDDLGLPEFFFMFTDGLVVFDRLTHSMKVVCCVKIDPQGSESDVKAAYEAAQARIEEIIELLRRPVETGTVSVSDDADVTVSSNTDKDRYLQMVADAKEHIFAGDIFQAVLSQRFEVPLSADPFDVYRVLRRVNPSPYMYYLRHGDLSIIGSSPEPLVTVEEGKVLTRPIAGTRRRGRTPEDEKRMEEELIADAKEIAEHVMLVDLGRNDVGRVCVPGTVSVDEFMIVEKYSHVMHIVSSVTGDLNPGVSSFDVLRAAFPAGTVSGAPKIRAMEIIDDLEVSKRGPYAGVIGYFGYAGSLDTCITIRTIITTGGKAFVQAGAGVVADSVAELEFLETQNKAQGLLKSVELAHEGQV